MLTWIKKHIADKVTEDRLIKRVRNGDKEAFGKLYLHYLDQIYRYIFYGVNQERLIAEDLTENVFIKALQKVKTYSEDSGTFQEWLISIAHTTLFDYYKTQQHTAYFAEYKQILTQLQNMPKTAPQPAFRNQIQETLLSSTPHKNNFAVLFAVRFAALLFMATCICYIGLAATSAHPGDVLYPLKQLSTKVKLYVIHPHSATSL